MTKKYNYMLSTATSDQFARAVVLCTDMQKFSDGSRVPNAAKWTMVMEFLGGGSSDFTLFSPVSYEEIYESDDATACIAASYMADLRIQLLDDIIARNPKDMVAHALYVRNRQWQVKLRERANLSNLQESFKSMRLT